MTATFETVLADVFEHGAERRLERGPEREAIAAAQFGDPDATIALVYAYAPVLRSLAKRHAARIGTEDARATAISGLMVAIHDFRLHEHEGQLAGIAHSRISNALREVASTAVSVPERTSRRYLQILRAAEGDYDRALALAPDYRMSPEVFAAVHSAFAANHLEEEPRHLDRATAIWAPADSAAFEDSEDAELLDLAWEAVNAPQRDVIRHAYAFETGDPMSDGEVAQAISVRDLGEEAVGEGQTTMSRATAQRHRTRGISAMKTAVGVA